MFRELARKKQQLSDEECFPIGAVNMRPECRNWIEMAARWLKELDTSK